MRAPLLAVFAALSLLAGAARAQLPANPLLELVTDQANGPMYVADPGDGRLFIVERTGHVRILVNPANRDLQDPNDAYLDLSGAVNNSENLNGEGGLLSIAFDPRYAMNGFVYAMYTRRSSTPDVVLQTVIARYTAQDSSHVDPNSGKILLALDSAPGAQFDNHKGGTLQFGPDGMLYAAFGDGGTQDDPDCRSQNRSLLHGKMIRIDPDGDDFPTDPNRNYAIPAGNPFRNDPNYEPEIWALGFRNPFRFSFDRARGDLWVGDVGGSLREEIDMDASPNRGRGKNYGWKVWEGNHCHAPEESLATCPAYVTSCTDDQSPVAPYTPPLFDYAHSGSASITGGYVYRGALNRAWNGVYIFADFVGSDIFALRNVGSGWQRTLLSDNDVPGPVGFGEDRNGELYVASLFTGKVFRLRFDRIGHTKQQEACVRSLNAGVVSLANARSLQIRSCVTRAANGSLARSYSSIDSCVAADPASRLDRLRTRNEMLDTRMCSVPPPDVGYAGAAPGNDAAVASPLDFAHDVFGADLDAAVVPRATDRFAAACQLVVANVLDLCQRTRRAEFLRCKSLGLRKDSLLAPADLAQCLDFDPNRRVARACSATESVRTATTISRFCTARSVDLSTAFPGCGDSDPAVLAECLDQAGRCRNCQLFDAADALGPGICDASCP
jgi:glucose/arabinose dehydrogenase